ncbi:MAG TPA: septum formation initiator family protein [Firmicutes bacterium]|nr:septum formation initiator family protein [Bacillota bacterium]
MVKRQESIRNFAVLSTKANKPKEQKIKKNKFLLVLIGILLLYFCFLFFSQFARYFQLKGEVNSLMQDVDRLREENDLLKEEVELLKDPEYLEELARSRLGMIRPGEVVLNIIEE